MTDKPWYERSWWLIKAIVFLLSCWFIFLHIREEMSLVGDSRRFFLQAIQLNTTGWWLWFLLFLSFINWSIEAVKWKFLMRSLEQVDFVKALRAFFNGVTLSFFTPNRAGEFAGRVIYLRSENTIKGALLSVIGSSSQLLVTLQFGFLALMFYIQRLVEWTDAKVLVLRISAAVMILLCTLAWFRWPRLVKLTDRLNIRTGWKEKLHVWETCSSKDLLKIWLLSVLRYTVFTAQSVLLYGLLGFQPGIAEMAGLTALSYLFITLIPSIALGELGIRGSVNMFLFSGAGAAPSVILLSTFGIWFINLAFPALFGATSVLFLKLRKRVTGTTA